MTEEERLKFAKDSYRIRRVMGWGTLLVSALCAGMGIFVSWKYLSWGAHWLFFLEPIIFIVAGLAIYRLVGTFFDPTACGLPRGYKK